MNYFEKLFHACAITWGVAFLLGFTGIAQADDYRHKTTTEFNVNGTGYYGRLAVIGDFNNDEHFNEKEGELNDVKANFIKNYNIPDEQASHVHTKIVAGQDILQKLIDVSAEFDLMIFSIDEYLNRPWYKRFFGGLDDQLTQKAICSVLKIRPSQTILLSPQTLEGQPDEEE